MKVIKMRDYHRFRINFKGQTVFARPDEIKEENHFKCAHCSRKVPASIEPLDVCAYMYDGDLIVHEHYGGKYFPRGVDCIFSERKYKSVWEKKVKEKMFSLKKDICIALE